MTAGYTIFLVTSARPWRYCDATFLGNVIQLANHGGTSQKPPARSRERLISSYPSRSCSNLHICLHACVCVVKFMVSWKIWATLNAAKCPHAAQHASVRPSVIVNGCFKCTLPASWVVRVYRYYSASQGKLTRAFHKERSGNLRQSLWYLRYKHVLHQD